MHSVVALYLNAIFEAIPGRLALFLLAFDTLTS
jgi:hypothetical protein